MSRIWLIAEQQFRKEVLKRGFIIAVLSLPLFILLSVGMGFLFSNLDKTTTTVGYVDEVNLLVQPLPLSDDNELALVAFSTVGEARAALEADRIDAYLVLPADYEQTERANLVFFTPPPYSVTRYFQDWVRLNLLSEQSPALVERIMERPTISIESTSTGRVYPAGGPTFGMFVPLITAALFAFMIMIAGGSMMTSVVEEKENRTMEVVVTSVSPAQMMAGKILGVVAMAVLLLSVWVAVFFLAVWIAGSVMEIGWMQSIDVQWRDVGLLALVAMPTMLLLAAFTTMLGATLVDSQEAEQVGPLLFMCLFIPLYLIVPIAQDANGVLAQVLSFIPIAGLSTLALRSLFFVVPAWQYVAAAAVALSFALVLVWLAGRAYRASMLRYGQRLRLSEILRAHP